MEQARCSLWVISGQTISPPKSGFVRYCPKADIGRPATWLRSRARGNAPGTCRASSPQEVRFTLESRHQPASIQCLLCAKSAHCRTIRSFDRRNRAAILCVAWREEFTHKEKRVFVGALVRLHLGVVLVETVAAIVAAHRAGTVTPEQTAARTFARIRAHGDPAIFISLRPEDDVLAESRALGAAGNIALPLYGVPVAVKDNIDVVGLLTTAACPAFRYKPPEDSTAVARLRAAGAIVIGKTNLDQFATGLVGVRSPYGIPRNPFNSELIPGGSSSGSAVAVAAGLVPLALGTDTAGSGRVPAGLNNIVGLKPSLGLISTFGVVPACRTLDCVSVLALTVDDAWTALGAMAGLDRADPYSRDRPLGVTGIMPPHVRLGKPHAGQLLFFGNRQYETEYNAALERLARLGCKLVEIDIEPFYETARLLYEGPWVAERTIAARSILSSDPDAIHPVTREIVLSGLRPTAIDAFAAFYKLEALRRVADHAFSTDRRVSAADRSHHLFHQTGPSRPNTAQQSTRYLHKFRQSARSLRIGDPRFGDGGRRAIRHHAAGAGWCRRAACRDRSRVPCRQWVATRRS